MCRESSSLLLSPIACGFREEVENAKIWFLSHNFMTSVEGATKTRRHNPGT